MALLKIARLGHPVLRSPAHDVPVDRVASASVQTLIDNMIDTMRESDGVGLAAPQVYEPLRIILVEVGGDNPRYGGKSAVPLTTLINPVIVDHSTQQVEDWEGCLSIPDLRGRVPRFQAVSISALTRTGEPIQFNATGFFARVLQHEIDHLDGRIFLDRMHDLSTLTHLREFQKYWLPQSLAQSVKQPEKVARTKRRKPTRAPSSSASAARPLRRG